MNLIQVTESQEYLGISKQESRSSFVIMKREISGKYRNPKKAERIV